MFKRIQLSNFKCIDQAQLELKPLTVLCGPNSSGKSSLTQSLLLLKQSSESIGGIYNLSPRGNIVDLGSYPEFIRNHDTNNLLRYRIDIDTTSPYLRSSMMADSFFMRRKAGRYRRFPPRISDFQ